MRVDQFPPVLLRPAVGLLLLGLAGALVAKEKPDFSGRWVLDVGASDDIEAELQFRKAELERRRLGLSTPTTPPGTTYPGTVPPSAVPGAGRPPTSVQPPHTPVVPPPTSPGNWGHRPGQSPPPTAGFPQIYDELEPLVKAVEVSGAGAQEIEVEKRGGAFFGTEDGVTIKWALDGSVKASQGVERAARWRGSRLFAQEFLADGSDIEWTWLLRKDGRLQITTRVVAQEVQSDRELPAFEVRQIYDPVE